MILSDWLSFFKKHADIKIFHINHLKLLTSENDHTLRIALSRLHKNKVLKRISRGFYANPFNTPSLEEISGQIYQPSYISLESALSFHGMLSQMPHILTCITTQLPRTFKTHFGVITYRQIKGAYFEGFVEKSGYAIAEPEKAFADYLYFSTRKNRKERLAHLSLTEMDRKKADRFLRKMNIAP